MISPENFVADPLRLLRAYRFVAELDFEIDPVTEHEIAALARDLAAVAVERVTFELNRILGCPTSGPVLRAMDQTGLLGAIFPELMLLKGVGQNEHHHLDVFDHTLEAVNALERLIPRPDLIFHSHVQAFEQFRNEENIIRLKWATLFHDLAKPQTCQISDQGKVTFYDHPHLGRTMFEAIGHRLKLSSAHISFVTHLIDGHMRPLSLITALRQEQLTDRAAARLVNDLGSDVVGLFLLVAADDMATRGPAAELDSLELLDELWSRVAVVSHRREEAATSSPPLITGHDLMARFDLPPGPVIGRILNDIKLARLAGEIQTKDQALDLALHLVSPSGGMTE
ncbi:MAG: HD domain-containing protein [Deltaproteobacteria bacterium]|nr:HD domain-containing protein [Deltaproteobacteria bacterium]